MLQRAKTRGKKTCCQNFAAMCCNSEITSQEDLLAKHVAEQEKLQKKVDAQLLKAKEVKEAKQQDNVSADSYVSRS